MQLFPLAGAAEIRLIPCIPAFSLPSRNSLSATVITATLQHLSHQIDQGLNSTQCVPHSHWNNQFDGARYFEYKQENVKVAGYPHSTIAYFSEMGYYISDESTTGSFFYLKD